MAVVRYGVRSLVMPTLPVGPTPEHRGFGGGYVDLSQQALPSRLETAAEHAVPAMPAPVTCGERLLEAFSRSMGTRRAGSRRSSACRLTGSARPSGRRGITADRGLRLCRPFGPSRGDWSRAQPAHDHVAHGTEVAHERLAGELGRIRSRATTEEAPCADVGVNLTVHPARCRMRPARHPPKRSRPILMP